MTNTHHYLKHESPPPKFYGNHKSADTRLFSNAEHLLSGATGRRATLQTHKMRNSLITKTLSLLLGAFSLGNVNASAQVFSSDFSGYTAYTTSANCPTYSCMNVGAGLSGCTPGLPQWGRLGTPSPDGNGSLLLVAASYTQEGIFANYNFQPGYTYTIHLGIKNYYVTVNGAPDYSFSNDYPGEIRVYAATGLQQTPDNLLNGCQEPNLESSPVSTATYAPPVADFWIFNQTSGYTTLNSPIPTIDVIGTPSPYRIPHTNSIVNDLVINYTPTVASNQIVIHPSREGADPLLLTLSYVRIAVGCDAHFTFTMDTRHPNTVKYTAHNSNPPNPTWNFGDGTTDWGTSVSHVFNNIGSYNSCLTIGGHAIGGLEGVGTTGKDGENPGCNQCATFCINEIEPESVIIPGENSCADFNYSVFTGNPYEVSFSPDDIMAPGQYTFWSFGDGTYDYSPTPVHQYSSPGTYNVCFATGGKKGEGECRKCMDVCIGRWGEKITLAAVDNLAEHFKASIYPNPTYARATLNVFLPETGDVNVQIIDRIGRVVKSKTAGSMEAGSHDIELETENLPSGIYNVIVKTAKHSVTSKLSIVK